MPFDVPHRFKTWQLHLEWRHSAVVRNDCRLQFCSRWRIYRMKYSTIWRRWSCKEIPGQSRWTRLLITLRTFKDIWKTRPVRSVTIWHASTQSGKSYRDKESIAKEGREKIWRTSEIVRLIALQSKWFSVDSLWPVTSAIIPCHVCLMCVYFWVLLLCYSFLTNS